MFTAKGYARKFYALLHRLRSQLNKRLCLLTSWAKPFAKKEPDYKNYDYCASTFVKLSKQMREGKNIVGTRKALIELLEGIKYDGHNTIESYLRPSIEAVLGIHRFSMETEPGRRSVYASN